MFSIDRLGLRVQSGKLAGGTRRWRYFRKAEVENFGMATFGYEDIRGLDVAVDKAGTGKEQAGSGLIGQGIGAAAVRVLGGFLRSGS